MPALTPAKLMIGKATGDPSDGQTPIGDIAATFATHTPLWAYVLIEAAATSRASDPSATVRLGPVGGHLVAETIGALLAGDAESYLNQAEFRPDSAFVRNGKFELADLINAALGR